jgi:hypothetical protein
MEGWRKALMFFIAEDISLQDILKENTYLSLTVWSQFMRTGHSLRKLMRRYGSRP